MRHQTIQQLRAANLRARLADATVPQSGSNNPTKSGDTPMGTEGLRRAAAEAEARRAAAKAYRRSPEGRFYATRVRGISLDSPYYSD